MASLEGSPFVGKIDYRKLTDCEFYVKGSCTKNLNCPFRHWGAAKKSDSVCSDWQNKQCTNEYCNSRHPTFKFKEPRQQHPSFGPTNIQPNRATPFRMTGYRSTSVSTMNLVEQGLQRYRSTSVSTMNLVEQGLQRYRGTSVSTMNLVEQGLQSPRQDGRSVGKNINKKQFLVKNFSPSMDENAMEQWMGFICDMAVSNVKFSYDKKSAMVGFKRPVEINLDDLKKKARTTALGSNLELLVVEFTKQVLIFGIPKGTTERELEQNVRAITGLLTINKIDLVADRNYAVVTFYSSTHAGNLVKGKLILEGSKLRCLYYNEDFVPEEIYEAMHGLSKTIYIKDYDKDIISFIWSRQELKSRLEASLDGAQINFNKKNDERNGDNGCLSVELDEYDASLEERVRLFLKKFISQFKQVSIALETLKLLDDEINQVIRSYEKEDKRCSLKINGKKMSITGKDSDVERARFRIDELLLGKIAEKNQQALETLARYLGNEKNPKFDTTSILELLNTEKGTFLLKNFDLVCEKLDNVVSKLHIERASVVLDKVGINELLKTENFENLRHRMLKKHSVASKFVCKQIPMQNAASPFHDFIWHNVLFWMPDHDEPMGTLLKYNYAIPSGCFFVESVVADIAKERVDVIVNTTTGSMSSTSGCSRSLYAAAGNHYAFDIRTSVNSFGEVGVWDFRATKAGYLHCKEVYHVVLGSFDSKKLQDLIVKVLEKASFYGYHSVAFPLLGTGGKGYNVETVLQVFKDSFEYHSKCSLISAIKLIKIVAYEKDTKSIRAMERFFKACQSAYRQDTVWGVHFIGFDSNDVNLAKKMLQKFVQENTVKVSFKLDALKDCPQLQKEQLFRHAKAIGVKMTLSSDGDVQIEGTPAGNTAVVNYIHSNIDTFNEVPHCWEPMPKDIHGKECPYHKVELQHVSKEFQEVEQEVKLRSKGRVETIRKLWRIQNPTLYKHYQLRKKAMDTANGSRNNERNLFHGTTKENLEQINHHGFNRSYAGKHAAAYGNGNYFAVNAEYSVGYAQPSQDGYRYMYIVKVLVGEYTQGKSGLKVAPCKGQGTELYDSVVNDVANPSIFVVFPDNQMYPEYLIQFK
ncbi:uncharacterized protein LOC135692660 isoform X6 [Rhopilema esculentum]|uniref:uncharacterized protein LOC135692660 isoform X4 n=2 Tax=Rhopilema esculentum TaxID=499914 RepID=UPI0031E107FB